MQTARLPLFSRDEANRKSVHLHQSSAALVSAGQRSTSLANPSGSMKPQTESNSFPYFGPGELSSRVYGESRRSEYFAVSVLTPSTASRQYGVHRSFFFFAPQLNCANPSAIILSSPSDRQSFPVRVSLADGSDCIWNSQGTAAVKVNLEGHIKTERHGCRTTRIKKGMNCA